MTMIHQHPELLHVSWNGRDVQSPQLCKSAYSHAKVVEQILLTPEDYGTRCHEHDAKPNLLCRYCKKDNLSFVNLSTKTSNSMWKSRSEALYLKLNQPIHHLPLHRTIEHEQQFPHKTIGHRACTD